MDLSYGAIILLCLKCNYVSNTNLFYNKEIQKALQFLNQ